MTECRLYFDEGARSTFWGFMDDLRMMNIQNPGLNNHVHKYDALFLRICVVHHMMRHAPNLQVSPIPDQVDETTATAVRELVMNFFLPHAKKIYGYFGEHPGRSVAERIAAWILLKKKSEFRRSDIAKLAPKEELKNLDAPLEYLEQMGWLRVHKTGGYPVRGGRPGEKLMVNPKVLEQWAGV